MGPSLRPLALHPDILELWKKGAAITHLPTDAVRKRVAEEAAESERESVPAVEEERVEDETARQEISPKEAGLLRIVVCLSTIIICLLPIGICVLILHQSP